MMSVEQLGESLVGLGFKLGQITDAPSSQAYIHRTGRVALAFPLASLENCFEPPHQDEAGAPWAVELKLEARWLHAADIFRRNGLPVERHTFEEYLSCLAKLGLFPTRVDQFYEFDEPDFLDLAVSINTKAEAGDLTPEVIRERVQPIVDALVRAELFLVFGATLDVLRSELAERAEQEKMRLSLEG